MDHAAMDRAVPIASPGRARLPTLLWLLLTYLGAITIVGKGP